jgi:polar amino acid transport system permease protein
MLDALHIVGANLPLLGKALLVTIELNVASIALAMVLGTVMGIGRVYGGRWVDRAFGFVIDVVRSIPILVIMVWVFFGLPLLLGLQDFPAFVAGVVALGVHSGVYIAEIVRGGLA